MRVKENAVFEALQRADGYLGENEAQLTGVDLTTARKRLDDIISSFTVHALDQDVGNRTARGETAKQQQLRTKLRRDLLRPIAVIARRNLSNTPEFTALQMPKPSAIGSAFIASVKGMANAATIHKDTLVEQGLPSTFLDSLTAGIASLEASIGDREKSRNQRVLATKGLNVEEKNGRALLRVLDSQVQQAVGTNEPLVRAWQAARLIRRRTGPVNDAAPAPATTSGTTPATVSGATVVTAVAPAAHLVNETTPAVAAA